MIDAAGVTDARARIEAALGELAAFELIAGDQQAGSALGELAPLKPITSEA